MPDDRSTLRSIRVCLGVVIIGLIVSGLTAFPLLGEMEFAARVLGVENASPSGGLGVWILTVRNGLRETYAHYPWIAYGTDWLAFAHLLLAVLFVGAYREPVRNKWIVDFGLIACGGVVLLAMIAGPVRGIPFYWRLMDCSFGVIACVPLYIARRGIARLERPR